MPAAARLDIIAQAQDQVTAVMTRVQKSLKTTGRDAKRLAGEVSAADASFNSARMAMSKARAGMKATAGRVEALGARLTKLGPAALGVGAAFGALSAAMAAGKSGAFFEARLARLGDSAGAVEARLRALQQAAGGGYSVAELAQFEAKQKELGIALNLNGAELEKLDALFISLGMDSGQALTTMVEGIGKGTTRTLKQIGLVDDLDARFLRFAESVGKSTTELTRIEKANIAIEAMREGLAGVDTEVGSTAGKWGAFFAAISDVGTMIQQIMAPLVHILEPVGQLLQKLALLLKSALQPVLIIVGRILGGVLKVVGALLGVLLDLLKIALLPVLLAVRELFDLFGANETAKDLDNVIQALTGSTEENTEATEDNAEAQRLATVAQERANRERVIAKKLTDAETKSVGRLSSARHGANASMIEQLKAQREAVDQGTRAYIDGQINQLERANKSLEMEQRITAERAKTTAAIEENMAAIEALEASKTAPGEETEEQKALTEEMREQVVQRSELTEAIKSAATMQKAALETSLERVNGLLKENQKQQTAASKKREVAERAINDQIKARKVAIGELEKAQADLESTIRGATAALMEQLGLGKKDQGDGGKGGGKSKKRQDKEVEVMRATAQAVRDSIVSVFVEGDDALEKSAREFQDKINALHMQRQEGLIDADAYGKGLVKLEEARETARLKIQQELEAQGLEIAAADRKRIELGRVLVQIEQTRLDLMRTGDPHRQAELTHQIDLLRVQQDLIRAGNDEISQQQAKEMAVIKTATAQERYNLALSELTVRSADAQFALSEISGVMNDASGAIGAMDKKAGALAGGVGSLANVWEGYAKGQGTVADAVAGTTGAIGVAAQQFSEDAALQAGIGMAMEIANAAAAGASMNFPKMAAHLIAASLYGVAIANAGGSGGGGGGATAGGVGPQATNQGPPGGGGDGGFGDAGDTGRTVIVQFGSGVVLGRPQDVAKGVAQAANSARNSGMDRARY